MLAREFSSSNAHLRLLELVCTDLQTVTFSHGAAQSLH
jgi:hypothetical protein